MSWFETDEPGDGADGDGGNRDAGIRRWPLHWEGLYPRERWLWFKQLWSDACALRKRYRLPLRSGWWADQVQVESLAALAAWSSTMTRASGTIRQESSRCSTTWSESHSC
jgi:hypothetical protein